MVELEGLAPSGTWMESRTPHYASPADGVPAGAPLLPQCQPAGLRQSNKTTGLAALTASLFVGFASPGSAKNVGGTLVQKAVAL